MAGQFTKVMAVSAVATNSVTLAEITSGAGLGQGLPSDLDVTDVVLTTDAATPASYFYKVGQHLRITLDYVQ